ncbi:HD domain-containing phosphohydrolase [Tolumonas lignilytica]|jgi:Response regulator containing a CheY-like receiver domain and an HD-GYP domain|uniref:HD domain-containing phosphohydrolase n=1 Tax=Tolumonas lignilytica TaxID=1283284 RepID=UPI000465F612|nr:HD domain-containing phosphohydrolase [Tolumonas lignilytica]
MIMDTRPVLLLVDDEPLNLQVLRQILQDEYRLLFAKDGLKALELAAKEIPALILLDVMMPNMSGHEVCRRLKQNPETMRIPVIFVTALAEDVDEAQGFNAGAVDYITKPVSPLVVRARIKTHLTLVSVDELKETRLQIVQRLGMAAEYKDNETGRHVIRMSHYSRIIALGAGFSANYADEILNAAPMHDIGKIGVPDHILKKPGKFTPEEWDIMRRHPQIGADIIGHHPAGLLRMAHLVALTHHEKWNGTGYPYQLEGEDIPIEGRIVAIADVFDALTSERPYKKAWSVDDAVQHLKDESGQHFDPHLIPVFIDHLDEILQIKERWPENIK